jgi:uncharacterized protein
MIMKEQFPCATCKGGCCGGVPISTKRLKIICDYLNTLPQTELKRLATQHRKDGDCAFLDITNYRCSIYSVRPWVCQAFGHIKKLQCPMVPALSQWLSPYEEDAEFEKEFRSGFALRSSEFNWENANLKGTSTPAFWFCNLPPYIK